MKNAEENLSISVDNSVNISYNSNKLIAISYHMEVQKMITKDTTLKDLFEYACRSADAIVKSGENFLVKDLFRGVEWNRIPKGNRTKLGAMFLSYVSGEGENAYIALGKTPQNQQIYKKK